MSLINFKCKKCRQIFDYDVGKITFSLKVDSRPKFKNNVKCPNCGVLTLDDLELTELGQTQLTDFFLAD